MKADKTTQQKSMQRIKGEKTARLEILDLCQQIVSVCDPLKVILFGSYASGASGSPNQDSDVDLLVVMPFEGHPAYQAGQLRAQLQTPMAVDLLVRTPEYIEERIRIGDPFMQEIVEQGIVLYETGDERLGSQGRARLDQRAA